MDKRAASTAPETPETPATDVLLEEDGLIEDDLLVEDVSIDGMCGVY